MHIKIIHTSRISRNGPKMIHCYCQFQIHAVHMLTSHDRCHVLRRVCLFQVFSLFWSTKHARKIGRNFNKHPIYIYIYICFPFSILPNGGPGSSVGIETDYRLDGPGSNPGGDEIFHPSRPALGPTQPPVQ